MNQMAYSVLQPAPSLQPMRIDASLAMDPVDYDHHGAYKQFVTGAGSGDRLRALRIFGWSYLKVLGKRLVRYEMIPLDYRRPHGIGAWLALVGTALRNMLTSGGNAVYDSLSRNGIAALAMPQERFRELEAMSAHAFHDLRARRERSAAGGGRSFEDSRYYLRRSIDAPLYEKIEAVLAEAGVLDAASRYLGRKVRLVDVNPQINDTSDNFWTRVFPDRQDEQPSCAYFHRDASGGDVKAIFYMCDVGPGQGPFEYAIASHAVRPRGLRDYVGEANDSNGLAGTEVQQRRDFAALPHALRLKCSFGNDVEEQSQLARMIAASKWPILAPAGSIVLFDTKGIHRGGLVREGERRVITCVLG